MWLGRPSADVVGTTVGWIAVHRDRETAVGLEYEVAAREQIDGAHRLVPECEVVLGHATFGDTSADQVALVAGNGDDAVDRVRVVDAPARTGDLQVAEAMCEARDADDLRAQRILVEGPDRRREHHLFEGFIEAAPHVGAGIYRREPSLTDPRVGLLYDGMLGEREGLAFVLVLLGGCDGMRIHDPSRGRHLLWEAGVPRGIRQITTEAGVCTTQVTPNSACRAIQSPSRGSMKRAMYSAKASRIPASLRPNCSAE
jgi:hypothetical protein